MKLFSTLLCSLITLVMCAKSESFMFPKFPWTTDEQRLRYLRKNIDVVDNILYDLIDKRLQLVKHVGDVKQQCVRDPLRETYILQRLRKKKKLNPTLVKQIWVLLFWEAYHLQEKDDDKNDQEE